MTSCTEQSSRSVGSHNLVQIVFTSQKIVCPLLGIDSAVSMKTSFKWLGMVSVLWVAVVFCLLSVQACFNILNRSYPCSDAPIAIPVSPSYAIDCPARKLGTACSIPESRFRLARNTEDQLCHLIGRSSIHRGVGPFTALLLLKEKYGIPVHTVWTQCSIICLISRAAKLTVHNISTAPASSRSSEAKSIAMQVCFLALTSLFASGICWGMKIENLVQWSRIWVHIHVYSSI